MIGQIYKYTFNCWNDRRSHVQSFGKLLTFIAMLVYMTAVAIAASTAKDATGVSSLDEHAQAIMSAQMYIILALAAGYVGIVSYVFLSNIKDLKNSIRDNTAALKADHATLRHEIEHDKAELTEMIADRVTIQMHNTICDKKIG